MRRTWRTWETVRTETTNSSTQNRAWKIQGGSSPLATIRFAPRARWFAEEVPVESVRNLPDGDFEVTLRVTNPGWLRSSLIRLAPLVRSVSPGALAAEVADAANGALALYGAGHGAGHGVGDAATSADHH